MTEKTNKWISVGAKISPDIDAQLGKLSFKDYTIAQYITEHPEIDVVATCEEGLQDPEYANDPMVKRTLEIALYLRSGFVLPPLKGDIVTVVDGPPPEDLSALAEEALNEP